VYDPTTARWLTPDPDGFDAGDPDLYRFVGNDPANATDPTGLKKELVITDLRERPGQAVVRYVRTGTPNDANILIGILDRSTGLVTRVDLRESKKYTKYTVALASLEAKVDEWGSLSTEDEWSDWFKEKNLDATSPTWKNERIKMGVARVDHNGMAQGQQHITGLVKTYRDFVVTVPFLAAAITVRRDIAPLSGGRSGQNVKDLKGLPANSAVRGYERRVYVTNSNGEVILDITEDRVKPVTPGVGFGPKRPPSPEELDLINKLHGAKSP
jgi:hypothetical protein